MKFAAALMLLGSSQASGDLPIIAVNAPKKHVKVNEGVQNVVGSAEVSCPPGYALEGPRCIRHSTIPPVPFCSNGVLKEVGSNHPECMILAQAERVCESGFVPHGNICLITRTAPAALFCPDSYEFQVGSHKYSSQCIRSISVPGGQICPPNSFPQNDRCFLESASVPVASCPFPEHQLVAGMCVGSERYECLPHAVPKQHVKDKKKLRMLEGKKHLAGIEEEVYVVDQICERRIASPPVLTCVHGGSLIGRECISSVEVPAVLSEGVVTTEAIPPIAKCPPEFSPCGTGFKNGGKKKNPECCSSVEVPYQIVCPPGLQLIGNDLCQGTTQVEWTCSDYGYKHNKHANECHMTEFVDPIVSYQTSFTCEGLDCDKKKHKKN